MGGTFAAKEFNIGNLIACVVCASMVASLRKQGEYGAAGNTKTPTTGMEVGFPC